MLRMTWLRKLAIVTVLLAMIVSLAAGSATPTARGKNGRTAFGPYLDTENAAAESSSPCNNGNSDNFSLEPTIAFSSAPDNLPPGPANDAAEIYLMKTTAAGDPDPTNTIRLTDNAFGDGFPDLSPDGTKIVFDSTRISQQTNVSDLFLMNADGSDQTFLTRGSSATWSPDCKQIAFHASASGNGTPIRPNPGSATTDSDIFVANVDDLLAGEPPRNLTQGDVNGQAVPLIDDDPAWSPDGQHIAYTAHPDTDNPNLSNQAEIYVSNADGTGAATQLTSNNEEERGPAWSPDGSQIVYSCRIGGGSHVFQICVINADGTGFEQLTYENVPHLTASWSPDGTQILFNEIHPPLAQGDVQNYQLYVMNADGSNLRQLTSPPGINLLAQWGQLRVHLQP
jgi:TolB protein